MLASMYVVSFLGIIILPIIAWIVFTRKFNLSWKLLLAGGLTFIVSQILHIPLVTALASFMAKNSLLVNAIILGLLAGIFEETARFILFKFILKKTRTWKEGVLVGLGHGGAEALLLGIAAVAAFVTMIGYRSVDLSTVPSIPADQLEVAKQQVAAYWSAPIYMPLVGFFERIFAMCLHVGLSVMVLFAITNKKPLWFWGALLWHAFVDAAAVYAAPQIGVIAVEGILAIMAVLTLLVLFRLRPMFADETTGTPLLETISA